MQNLPDYTAVPIKPFWLSKTLIFNAAGVGLLALGLFLDNYKPLGISIPDQAAAWLAMISLIGNGVLRVQTWQPIGAARGVALVDNTGAKMAAAKEQPTPPAG